MTEPDRTDQEIDNAIREWKLKFRDIPDALNVSRDRVQERWAGPGPGVAEDLDSAEVENAVVTTFGLERDVQRTLRENIAQLEPGLRIIDGGHERRCAAGLIDILCEDADGARVVIELKAGFAKDAALGQMLGYMGALKREMGEQGEQAARPVRGILVAKGFDDRVRHASFAVPILRLMSYQVRFYIRGPWLRVR